MDGQGLIKGVFVKLKIKLEIHLTSPNFTTLACHSP